jgi:hypothetical protein
MATQANFLKGNAAEQKFQNLANELGWDVIESTIDSDRYEHIDFVITWGNPQNPHEPAASYSVDVKAQNELADCTWIEIRNTQGEAGWLYGNADLIAFDKGDKFVVVEREVLKDWIEENVAKEYVTEARDAHMKVYSRPDKNDMLTLVKTYHLIGLATGEMKGKGYIARKSQSVKGMNSRA